MPVISQTRAQRKLRVAAKRAEHHLPTGNPPVFWMTDPERTVNLLHTVSNLPAGWGVIYRHFGKQDRVSEAKQLSEACQRRKIRFLVANDPLLAMECQADGVHWPHAAWTRARLWRKRFRLMTVSAHSGHDVRTLPNGLFDGVIISCVFASDSPSAGPAMGAQRFRAIADASPLPCYALGGVTAHNAAQIAPAGGFAMVSGIQNVFGD